jgi:exonuclease SbcC
LLEYVELCDFQRHERLRVDFAPGVTTLCGPTDAGKTAVFRAVRWVCLNLPAGGRLTRHGAARCKVALGVDGRKVARVRGDRENLYRLDGEDYRAFGQGVPPEIAKLLGLDAVNFARQFDAPFFLTMPAPEVSRQLNAVVDLGVIDGTLAAAASKAKAAQAELLRGQISLSEATSEADSLDYVNKLSHDLTVCEALEDRIADKAAERASVAKCLENARRAAEQVDRVAEPLKRGSAALADAAKTADCLRDARKRRDGLSAALARAQRAGEQCRAISKSLSTARKALAELSETCPLCGAKSPAGPASSPCSAATCT